MKEKHYKELRISCNPEQTKAAAHACSTFRHGGLIVFVFPEGLKKSYNNLFENETCDLKSVMYLCDRENIFQTSL